MIRSTLKTSALAALVLGTGIATGVAQTSWVEASDSAMLMPWNVSADAVEDLDVMGADGQKIGDVEEVIGGDAATPSALVIDFDDDAGYGDRDDVVVPAESFTYANNMLTLDADPAAVGGMQVWDD